MKKLLLTLLLFPTLAFATPRVGVYYNQLYSSDPISSPIDFAWVLQANSPPLDYPSIVKQSKAKRTVLTGEGIDANWLLYGWSGNTENITILKDIEKYGKPYSYAFVYYEFNGGPTLHDKDIPTAYSYVKHPMILLYRGYDPKYINQTLLAWPKNITYGAAFEFAPEMDVVVHQQIGRWIDYVYNHGRTPFLLIPPSNKSTAYVHDVITALKFIKKESKQFEHAVIIFAVYNRNFTHVSFKQVDSAIKIFRYNF